MASKTTSKRASKAGSQKSSIFAPIRTDWKQYVNSRQLNVYTWSVHVVCLVEFNCEHIKYLDLFNEIAGRGQRTCINIISADTLMHSLQRYSNLNEDLHPELRLVYPSASEEVTKFLNKKGISGIPLEILAKLIKLEILRLKLNHFTLMEKKRRLKMEIKEEFTEMLGDPKKCIAQSLKSGKQLHNNTSIDTTLDIEMKKEASTKLYKHGEEWKQWDDIDDSPKSGPNLYIVLSMFYNPNLIIELIQNDIPVIGIIQMRRDNDTLDNISDFKVDKLKTAAFVRRVNDIHNFWKSYAELIKKPNNYEKLENTAFVTFKTPIFTLGSKNNFADIDHITLYDDLSFAIYEIEDILRQYASFMKNMHILRTHEHIQPLNKFTVYNGMINLIPTECVTIPIMLNCMLEQVVSTLSPKITDIKDELAPKSGGSSSSSQTPSISSYYGKFRTKYLRIFDRIAKDTKFLFPNTHCETFVKTKPIVIEYGNDIKYKSFHIDSLNLEEITLNVLYYHIVPILWRSIPLVPEDEAILYSCHITKLLQETPNKTIDKDVLWHYIHIKIFEKMICTSNKKLSEIQTNFTSDDNNDNLSTGKQFNLRSVENLSPLVKNQRNNLTLNDILFSTDLAKLYNRFDTDIKTVSNDFDSKKYTSYERLNCSVMLQKLYDASLKYNCIDYHHFEFTDVLLLQFHNSYPKNGIIKDEWEISLPTAVCFRDFVNYVYNEHQQWIKDYETNYKQLCKIEEKLEAKRSHMQKFNEELLKIAPDTLFSESLQIVPEVSDYLLPGSIKELVYKQKQEELAHIVSKSHKESRSYVKAKKEKSKHQKLSGKSGLRLSPQQQIELNLFPAYPPDSPYHKITLPVHPADDDMPYEFIGYDLGTNRIQFNGHTQYFHSSDQSFVKVETMQKTFTDEKTLAIEIHKHGHSLFLYSTATSEPSLLKSKEFMFHITVSNGVIMSFSTPNELKFLTNDSKSKTSVIKRDLNDRKSYPAITSSRNTSKVIEFVTEEPIPTISTTQRKHSSANISTVIENQTKRQSNKNLDSLIEESSKLNEESTITENEETVKLEDKTIENESGKHHKSDEKHLELDTKFQATKTEEKQPEINNRFLQRMTEEKNLHSLIKLHEDVEILKPKLVMQSLFLKRKNEFFDQLETARLNRNPCFKIHSSKLHTYRYIKRIKPFVTINIRGIVKKLFLKPLLSHSLVNRVIKKAQKSSKHNFEKWKNVSSKSKEPTIPLHFKLNCSWPNGLCAKTVETSDEFMPYYIKQSFLPLPKNFDELSRCFLSNGQLLIFYKGGRMKILCSDSTIYNCQVDGFKPISLKPNLKKIRHNRKTTMSYKFHKILKEKIHIQKHLISTQNSLRIPYTRQMNLRKQKRCFRIASKMFKCFPDHIPIPEYNVLTPDGNYITVRNNKICNTSAKLFVDITTDLSHNEVYIEREDGTTIFLHGENGNMNVLFPDGTRITSWFEIEEKEILIDFTDEEYQELLIVLNDEKLHTTIFADDEISSSDSDDSLTFEPFVSVILICIFEHPKYARINIRNGVEFNTEISMLDDVNISLDRNGQYVCDLDDTTKISLLSSMICFEHVTCCSCSTKSSSIINYRPFIENNNCHEKDYYVSNVNTMGQELHIDFDGNVASDNIEIDITADDNHRCRSYMDNKIIDKRFFLLKRQLDGSEFINDVEQKQYLSDCKAKKFSSIYNDGDEGEMNNSTIVTYGIETTYSDSWLQPLSNMLPMYLKRKDTLPSTYYPENWLSPFYNRESSLLNMSYYNSCCMDALYLNQSVTSISSTQKSPIAIIRRNFISLIICCDQSIQVVPLFSNTADNTAPRRLKRPYETIVRIASAMGFRDRWFERKSEEEYYKKLLHKQNIPQYFSKDMEAIMFDVETQSESIASSKVDKISSQHILQPSNTPTELTAVYKADLVDIAKKWVKYGYNRYQPQFRKSYSTATQTECVYICPIRDGIHSENDETSEFCACQKKSRIPIYNQRVNLIQKKSHSTSNMFDERLIKPKLSSKPATVCGTGTKPILQKMALQISPNSSVLNSENFISNRNLVTVKSATLKPATVRLSTNLGMTEMTIVEHKPRIVPSLNTESIVSHNSRQISGIICGNLNSTRNSVNDNSDYTD